MGKLRTQRQRKFIASPFYRDETFHDWISQRKRNYEEGKIFQPLNSVDEVINSDAITFRENRSINDERKLITVQKSRLGPAIPCLDIDCETKESTLSNVSIFGTVLRHNTNLLVDTGAAISDINDRFYNHVLRHHFVLKENSKIENIRTAIGRVVPVSRSVTFPIRVGSFEYTVYAHVVHDLSYKVVLRRDFIAESRAIINVYELWEDRDLF